MGNQERGRRFIARGEVSNHSHVITGECEIETKEGNVYIRSGKGCVIKHLLEKEFIEEGVEIWTKEHKDILLREGGVYKFVQQIEYNPYSKLIQQVKD